MEKIKEEYKGKTLSNRNIPRLVVDNITEDMIPYTKKMGFGFIFTSAETEDTTDTLLDELREDIGDTDLSEKIAPKPKKKRTKNKSKKKDE